MFIKAIAVAIAALGFIFWFIGRRYANHATIVGENSETKRDQSENNDELDDAQAAEVVATWNLLNPP